LSNRGPTRLASLLLLACTAAAAFGAQPAPPPEKATPRDPYKDIYAKYTPSFLRWMATQDRYGGEFQGWRPPEKVMKLSSELAFFTLNLIHQDSRADALVKAAIGREQQGRYRDALKMYQMVIDKYPHVLYRVSKFGVFVPISQYCQRRILGFPPRDLDFYRTVHDARARESFDQARRKNSLIGLSEIVDRMLATSYGGRAIVELGNASLDNGHYLAALEYFSTIRDFFPPPQLRTPELDLKVAYCLKMLGGAPAKPSGKRVKSDLPKAHLERLETAVAAATRDRPPFHSQLASPGCLTTDDYTLLPPTKDPLSLAEPVWKRTMPGSRNDYFLYAQPVVSSNSIIYRHKNIVYSRSILNGELRWVNDLGGRAIWQTWHGRKFPMEDLLVQDGLVFATLYKGGPSLVALDEVTGQLKWAFGPMAAATEEEARMRFEAAPAGGPRTVYANYVLDNIEGETHTDTEYGVIAFESTTGRVQWRKPLCRLAPGKFSAGFAVRRRNRVRSYTSPPLYHQGTVYCNTNAGGIAALDARSGRVKWLMRYPSWPGIHDATRAFGGFGQYTPLRMNSQILWYNQRPLVLGDRLYVLPVDTKFMFCIDRRNGKVLWCRPKGSHRGGSHNSLYEGSATYFLGPIATGELVMVYSSRQAAVHLVDPATGKTVWSSGDPVAPIGHPSMRHYFYFGSGVGIGAGADRWNYQLAARPFLSSDGIVCLTSFHYWGYPVYGWAMNLCRVSLADRKILGRRRYLSGELISRARHDIGWAPKLLKELEDLPHKDAKVKARMKAYREMAADTVPVNPHGPFMPHSRVTFKRYGVLFELRFGPRHVAMVYEREAVRGALAKQTGPEADFARAELDFADARYRRSADLLKKCLATISSEDLDFRAVINQQLFRVHQRLGRSAIRAADLDHELAHCLGMSRTASTLAEEIETLFALSEAYTRRGKPVQAARALRSVISTYGHHEYPLPRASAGAADRMLAAARAVIDRAHQYVNKDFYGREMSRSLELLKKGLPVYVSTLSPLPKDFTMRAGDLAAARLIRLQQLSPDFAAKLEADAGRGLTGRDPEEQFYRLWEFAGTRTAQEALARLFAGAAKTGGAGGRRRMWHLADAARVCGLRVPAGFVGRVSAPPAPPAPVPLRMPMKEWNYDFKDKEGAARLVLERRGDRTRHPDLVFFGARVRKRLDNKFVLTCMDLRTRQVLWEESNIRLKGKGQEPGFFEAFVHGELVVVHGLYDVLAYGIKGHELKWRYRVPFDFEIKHAVMSGDLLVLSGKAETLALYVPASSKSGEVVWQEKEQGDVYVPPYFCRGSKGLGPESGARRDRLILVRKMPFNVTARYRSTGKLIGRLDLPDLSLHERHPLIDGGPKALPVAHDEDLLVVTDSWYYIAVDTTLMKTRWKRLIDQNDLTREPAMRLALKGGYLAVLKENYDQKAIYMLSSRTGEVLWRTDPKNARSPQPMFSTLILGDKAFALAPHPGRGFYFVGRDCKTGKQLFSTAMTKYDSRPNVRLRRRAYGDYVVAEVQDRQTFELHMFDVRTGKLVHEVRKKGVGSFGVHGRVSATVQNGRLVFLSKNKLSL